MKAKELLTQIIQLNTARMPIPEASKKKFFKYLAKSQSAKPPFSVKDLLQNKAEIQSKLEAVQQLQVALPKTSASLDDIQNQKNLLNTFEEIFILVTCIINADIENRFQAKTRSKNNDTEGARLSDMLDEHFLFEATYTLWVMFGTFDKVAAFMEQQLQLHIKIDPKAKTKQEDEPKENIQMTEETLTDATNIEDTSDFFYQNPNWLVHLVTSLKIPKAPFQLDAFRDFITQNQNWTNPKHLEWFAQANEIEAQLASDEAFINQNNLKDNFMLVIHLSDKLEDLADSFHQYQQSTFIAHVDHFYPKCKNEYKKAKEGLAYYYRLKTESLAPVQTGLKQLSTILKSLADDNILQNTEKENQKRIGQARLAIIEYLNEVLISKIPAKSNSKPTCSIAWVNENIFDVNRLNVYGLINSLKKTLVCQRGIEHIKEDIILDIDLLSNLMESLLLILHDLNMGRPLKKKGEVTLNPFRLEALHFKVKQKNIELQLFKKFGMEDYYEKWKSLTPVDSDESIPSIFVDGAVLAIENEMDTHHAQWDYRLYYLTKMSAFDPRCAFLGKLTACCQSLGAAGADCAIYGITQPNSGFYVLCRKESLEDAPSNSDTVIGQSWVFRTPQGTLILDNVEALPEYRYSTLLADFYREAVRELVNTHQIEKINIGLGYNKALLSNIVEENVEAPPQFKEGAHYDSAEQNIVYAKNLPFTKWNISTIQEIKLDIDEAYDPDDYENVGFGRILYHEDTINYAREAVSLNYRILTEVIKRGRIELVKYMIEEKDAVVGFADVWTALSFGEVDIYKYLLEEDKYSGPEIDMTLFELNGVYLSIRNSRVEMLKHLCIKNSEWARDLDLIADFIHFCVELGCVQNLDFLFKHYLCKFSGYNVVDICTEFDLVCTAIKTFNHETLEYLLNKGALMSKVAKYSPAYIALEKGNISALELLARYEYDIKADWERDGLNKMDMDKLDIPSLAYLIRAGIPFDIQLFHADIDDLEIYEKACIQFWAHEINKSLKKNLFTISDFDNLSVSLMNLALKAQDFKLIETLIMDNNHCINEPDIHSKNLRPLAQASQMKHPKCVEYLLSRGAKIQDVNTLFILLTEGDSAWVSDESLHQFGKYVVADCAKLGKFSVVDRIIDLRIDLNTPNEEGIFAASYFIEQQQSERYQKMREQGGVVNSWMLAKFHLKDLTCPFNLSFIKRLSKFQKVDLLKSVILVNDDKTLKIMLDLNWPFQAKNQFDLSPVELALERFNHNILKLFYEKIDFFSIYMNQKINTGKIAPLWYVEKAFLSNDENKALQVILMAIKNKNVTFDDYINTDINLAVMAIEYNKSEWLKKFIETGFLDLNKIQLFHNKTLLQIALKCQNQEAVDILLNNNVEEDLDTVKLYQWVQNQDHILPNKSPQDIMIQAVKLNDSNLFGLVLQKLISNGIDPYKHVSKDDRSTPFESAFETMIEDESMHILPEILKQTEKITLEMVLKCIYSGSYLQIPMTLYQRFASELIEVAYMEFNKSRRYEHTDRPLTDEQGAHQFEDDSDTDFDSDSDSESDFDTCIDSINEELPYRKNIALTRHNKIISTLVESGVQLKKICADNVEVSGALTKLLLEYVKTQSHYSDELILMMMQRREVKFKLPKCVQLKMANTISKRASLAKELTCSISFFVRMLNFCVDHDSSVLFKALMSVYSLQHDNTFLESNEYHQLYLRVIRKSKGINSDDRLKNIPLLFFQDGLYRNLSDMSTSVDLLHLLVDKIQNLDDYESCRINGESLLCRLCRYMESTQDPEHRLFDHLIQLGVDFDGDRIEKISGFAIPSKLVFHFVKTSMYPVFKKLVKNNIVLCGEYKSKNIAFFAIDENNVLLLDYLANHQPQLLSSNFIEGLNHKPITILKYAAKYLKLNCLEYFTKNEFDFSSDSNGRVLPITLFLESLAHYLDVDNEYGYFGHLKRDQSGFVYSSAVFERYIDIYIKMFNLSGIFTHVKISEQLSLVSKIKLAIWKLPFDQNRENILLQLIKLEHFISSKVTIHNVVGNVEFLQYKRRQMRRESDEISIETDDSVNAFVAIKNECRF